MSTAAIELLMARMNAGEATVTKVPPALVRVAAERARTEARDSDAFFDVTDETAMSRFVRSPETWPLFLAQARLRPDHIKGPLDLPGPLAAA